MSGKCPEFSTAVLDLIVDVIHKIAQSGSTPVVMCHKHLNSPPASLEMNECRETQAI